MAAADVLRWLAEATLATSALIILVLILRRPTARRFGAETACLLWLAPALRFLTPELALLPPTRAPAALAPQAITADGLAPALNAALSPAATAPVSIVLALVLLWATGALVFALAQFGAQLAFSRRIRLSSAPAPSEITAEAATVAWRRGFQRRFELRVAADETGPLVAGLMRPVIVVPASFMQRLSSPERQMALAHEIAHVVRGDLYAACAATLFRSAQWFNPLAHIAWRAFRADQEAACDALVLGRTEDSPDAAEVYAKTLVKSAYGPQPSCALSIAFNLKERLVLMKSMPNARPARARIAALLAVVCGVAVTASYSSAEEKPAKSETAKRESTVEINRITVVGDDEKAAPAGEKSDRVVVIRRSKEATTSGGAPGELPPLIVLKDGDADGVSIMTGTGPVRVDGAECTTVGGKPTEALVDEKSERSDEGRKIIQRTVICSSAGTKGDPKKEADALRKALVRMQDEAKREAETRAKTIAAIEARIAELEKQSK